MARKKSGRRQQTRKIGAANSVTEDFKAQLEQKNQLVEQLTEQLNDANQRLLAAENESQPGDNSDQILECVTALLARNDELQPAKMFQRLEDKIDDLRSRSSATAAPVAASNLPKPTTNAAEGTWEEIRSNMLQEAGLEPKPEEQMDDEDALAGLEAPEPIDFDTASPEDLQLAVERRDAYAVCLLHQMRVVERRKLITAEELLEVTDLPDEMTEAIVELEGRLQQVLRMTEVELSMERARVSRESVRVLAQQAQLAKQEAEIEAQRESLHMAPATPVKSNRKWLTALGFAKD